MLLQRGSLLTTSPMPIVQSGAPVEFLAKWYVSPSSVYQNCWHPLTCPVKISLPPTELSLQYPDVAAKGSLEEKSVSLFFGSPFLFNFGIWSYRCGWNLFVGESCSAAPAEALPRA